MWLLVVAWCGPKNDQKLNLSKERSGKRTFYFFFIATDELKYLVHDRICQRGISGCGFIPPWFLIDLVELKYYIICNFHILKVTITSIQENTNADQR